MASPYISTLQDKQGTREEKDTAIGPEELLAECVVLSGKVFFLCGFSACQNWIHMNKNAGLVVRRDHPWAGSATRELDHRHGSNKAGSPSGVAVAVSLDSLRWGCIHSPQTLLVCYLDLCSCASPLLDSPPFTMAAF
jgi:hypothetical protein